MSWADSHQRAFAPASGPGSPITGGSVVQLGQIAGVYPAIVIVAVSADAAPLSAAM